VLEKKEKKRLTEIVLEGDRHVKVHEICICWSDSPREIVTARRNEEIFENTVKLTE